MPVYQWIGKNRSNKVQKGEMEAQSEEAVRASLLRQKITPWNDPDISVPWAVTDPLLSDKDRVHPRLRDAENNFRYSS